ncbi:MAG TPA: hypothetical protein VIT67_15180 [Povalibacter sp.]|jgi:hypothetical protein
MSTIADIPQRQNLREQVERLLPSWQSWYPSLFHAAEDLGLIRARVCAPSSLMLSSRHAAIQDEALRAFREQWGVEDEPEIPQPQHLQLIRRMQNQARANGKKPTPQQRRK